MKGTTISSLVLASLISTALYTKQTNTHIYMITNYIFFFHNYFILFYFRSYERTIEPKSSQCGKDCDFKYGYAYDIGLNNRICIDCDNTKADWFPTKG